MRLQDAATDDYLPVNEARTAGDVATPLRGTSATALVLGMGSDSALLCDATVALSKLQDRACHAEKQPFADDR